MCLRRSDVEVLIKLEKEEGKKRAGFHDDGNMFYGPDGRPMRKLSLKELSCAQSMAYTKRNASAN